jgi:hypothetical protein
MPVVKVQKIPKKKHSAEDILASFCYNYPQYTYNQAKNMPYKRILHMLTVARKEHARKMIDLVRIVAAPQSKNGRAIKNLIKEFNDILDS